MGQKLFKSGKVRKTTSIRLATVFYHVDNAGFTHRSPLALLYYFRRRSRREL